MQTLAAARTAAFQETLNGSSVAQLLKRPDVSWASLPKEIVSIAPPEIWELIETEFKYAGYINKQSEQNRAISRRDFQKIPDGIDFSTISGLRSETRQKLSAIRPTSLGQAARISGITPADLSIISIWLNKKDLRH
jgi:tRNA uridine 5-carboxymethylaminomethyl modification enzyme